MFFLLSVVEVVMGTSEATNGSPAGRRGPANRPKQCPRKNGKQHAVKPNGPDPKPQEPRPISGDMDFRGRPGDTGVGRPRQCPRTSQPVERKPTPRSDESQTVDAELFSRRPEIWAPSILRLPFVYFGGLLLLSLLGIWLLTSVIELIGSLALLSPWLIWTSAAILVILLAVVLFLLMSVAIRYLRVPYRPQLVLRQVTQARIIQYGAYRQARIELSDNLREIEALGPEYIKLLKRMGLTDSECSKFKSDMSALLRDRAIDGQAWLNEYQDNIQSVLDDLARRRQRHYATIVGLKTAISPWQAVDLMAVLYNSTLLVRDLCFLANRRADNLQTLSLLVHVGFNMFVASEAQELAKTATDNASEGYEQFADDLMADRSADIVADGAVEGAKGLAADSIKAVSKFAVARLGEGLANAWLTQRFGARVWSLLTPLAD